MAGAKVGRYSMSREAVLMRRRRLRGELETYSDLTEDELEERLHKAAEQMTHSRLRMNAINQELRRRGQVLTVAEEAS